MEAVMATLGYPICHQSANTCTVRLPLSHTRGLPIFNPLTSHLRTSLCPTRSLQTPTPTLETRSPWTPSTLLTHLPANSKDGPAARAKNTEEFPTTTDRGWSITSPLWTLHRGGWVETSKEDQTFFFSMVEAMEWSPAWRTTSVYRRWASRWTMFR